MGNRYSYLRSTCVGLFSIDLFELVEVSIVIQFGYIRDDIIVYHRLTSLRDAHRTSDNDSSALTFQMTPKRFQWQAHLYVATWRSYQKDISKRMKERESRRKQWSFGGKSNYCSGCPNLDPQSKLTSWSWSWAWLDGGHSSMFKRTGAYLLSLTSMFLQSSKTSASPGLQQLLSIPSLDLDALRCSLVLVLFSFWSVSLSFWTFWHWTRQLVHPLTLIKNPTDSKTKQEQRRWDYAWFLA